MIEVRTLTEDSRTWVQSVLHAEWQSLTVVRPGRVYDDASALAGFAAVEGGQWIGLALYDVAGDECELVVLNSLIEDRGAGTAVTAAVVDAGRTAGCRRAVVFTTNDNLRALGFYQRRGWDLVSVHRNAMDQVREVKRDVWIPTDGAIPLRHLLELEITY